MRSLLLAIGCDHYSAQSPLYGAEADARRVFSALTAAGQPYSPSDSRLLLSPTSRELEDVLRQLPAGGQVDVLTLYFAGHGGVSGGNYYFCVRDTKSEYMSGTGFPLHRWLEIVKDLKPQFGYVIADSCNSGGAHRDIAGLLSDPRVGYHEASTFVCLAAASADQYASEVEKAGVMTTELLKVINGSTPVSTDRKELDLLDVARVVSEQVTRYHPNQRPVTWGLNLFGSGRLCRSPNYTAGAHPFSLPDLPPGSALAENVLRHLEPLWKEYRELEDGPNLDRLRDLVQTMIQQASPADSASLIQRLADGFTSQMESRSMPWERAELLGMFAALLLPHVATDGAAASVARGLVERKLRLEADLIPQALREMEADFKLFIRGRYPMADSYYLPLRLTKFLAVVASAVEVAPKFNVVIDQVSARALIGRIISSYPNALNAVSDQQAPYLYVWFKRAATLGWVTELEAVFGSVFSDLVSVKGKIARDEIDPRIACDYAMARGADLTSVKLEWLANPSTLLAVALLAAAENDLIEVVDPFLEHLDHRRLNLYFPADYRDFANKRMEEGINRTHVIGHDVWTVADFVRHFDRDWGRHKMQDRLPSTELERTLVTYAALVFTDRTPLCLQEDP